MSAAVIENIIPVGLLMFANSVNDTREKSMINRWSQEYQMERDRRARLETRRLSILRAVSEGYDIFSEISGETGISRTTLGRTIREMVRKKEIRQIKIINNNRRIEYRFELIG